MILKWRMAGCIVGLVTVVLLWKMHKSLQDLEDIGEQFDDKQKQFLSNKAGNILSKKDTASKLQLMADRAGLTSKNAEFYLDARPFQILGGSLHYFRFPQEYWYARLLALKACGINTVTTYIPWNAHEPSEGNFDFTGMLNLPEFLKTAQSLDLYVILRVGPYICAEWEWGGLPSWLLRHDSLRVRSNDPVYMRYVTRYFDKLLPMIEPHQYVYGGPVIAVQVENEYATYSEDPQHVITLRDMIINRGIKEFLFVCDDRSGTEKNLDYGGLMKSVNFQHSAKQAFQILKRTQPDLPLFVSEYWTGWFNTWGGKNNNMGVPWLNTLTAEKFESNTIEALDVGKNINFYVFVGGTNFGFMNGAALIEKRYSPDTTSYDYSALIAEDGKLTKKYHIARKILQAVAPNDKLPLPPPDPVLASYGSITLDAYVTIFDLMDAYKSWMIKSDVPISFENFPSVGDRKAGQSYGYAVYEFDLHTPVEEVMLGCHQNIHDQAHIFSNKIYQGTVNAFTDTLLLKTKSGTDATMSLLVENQGRINWVPFGESEYFNKQRKGIVGNITANGKVISGWRIWPFDFGDGFLSKLSQYSVDGTLKWKSAKLLDSSPGPAVLKSVMTINEQDPKDTYIELEGFGKGIALVNGHNLGRYWNSAGPQRRLFVPGVWLHRGNNEILVFEESNVGKALSFHSTSGIDT